MTARQRAVALTAAAAAVVVALIPAHAQALQCGKVVMKSITLKDDLVNCPADGLVVGAPGITIDLNGHRIDGVGATDSVGILNDEFSGHEDLEVVGRGGRVSGFDHGIEIEGDGNVIRGVSVRNAQSYGIFVNFADRARVRDNRLIDTEVNGIGVRGERVKVLDNEVRGPEQSGFTANGIAVTQSTSEDILIKGNKLTGGGDGDDGIIVHLATHTRVVKNVARRFQQQGVVVHDGAIDTAIRANTVKRNAWGITIEATTGAGTQVIGNRADDNDLDGIEIKRTGTAVGDNRANSNGEWGIEAIVAVVDLGGNSASGNGQQDQCLGIVCD